MSSPVMKRLADLEAEVARLRNELTELRKHVTHFVGTLPSADEPVVGNEVVTEQIISSVPPPSD